ncbi:MAG: hypothetical protein ONB05_01770, partial [candidate division KSB1 bacterium]|nr:hypothetical protein [candidate division KSB1 bacterium]
KLQWGAYHQPFGGLANNNLLNKGLFFSGAELSYKPSDKFFIKLQYHSLPYGVYDPYYRNYYRGRDWFEEEE